MKLRRTYVIEVEFETDTEPVGCGCESHERTQIENSVKLPLLEAVSQFYQCFPVEGTERLTIRTFSHKPGPTPRNETI